MQIVKRLPLLLASLLFVIAIVVLKPHHVVQNSIIGASTSSALSPSSGSVASISEPHFRTPFPSDILLALAQALPNPAAKLELSDVNVSDPRLGDHGETCPQNVFPCCTGMLHNGGGHQFGECGQSRRLWSPSYANHHSGLDLIRAVGNRTLVMIGDSVSHQEFMALECACRVWSVCRVLQRTRLDFPNQVPCTFWRQRISGVETVKIQVGGTVTTLQFVSQYQPCVINDTWVEEDTVIKLNPDILVTSVVGAHFSETTTFVDMNRTHALEVASVVLRGKLVQNMLKASKPVVLVEAAAQHFPKPGGDYWSPVEYNHTKYNMSASSFALQGCFPIIWDSSMRLPVGKYEFNQHQWKAKLMHAIMEEFNIPTWWANSTSSLATRGSIAWVPLFDLTASRSDLHEKKRPQFTDCTHICYDALFWVPFVDSVTRSIMALS